MVWLIVGLALESTILLSLVACVYLLGKALLVSDRRGEAYKKVAGLAISDAEQSQKLLDDVLALVLEMEFTPKAKTVTKPRVGKEWD